MSRIHLGLQVFSDTIDGPENGKIISKFHILLSCVSLNVSIRTVTSFSGSMITTIPALDPVARFLVILVAAVCGDSGWDVCPRPDYTIMPHIYNFLINIIFNI